MRRLSRFVAVFATLSLLTVGLVATPVGALTTTRAELKGGGDLRVEGEAAAPNSSISVDGVVLGSADEDGDFRVERWRLRFGVTRAWAWVPD